MHMRKKINQLGKKYYDFDYKKEKYIYMYLWRKHLSKNKLNKIESKYKFDKYSQWKQYIHDKYNRDSDDSLDEFRHFLNQMLRNNRPEFKIWNIAGTVLITLVVNSLYNYLMLAGKLEIKNIGTVIGLAIAYIIIVVIMVFVINTILKQFDNSTIQESFYQDYIEIIDDMIEKRKKEKRKRNN